MPFEREEDMDSVVPDFPPNGQIFVEKQGDFRFFQMEKVDETFLIQIWRNCDIFPR